MLLSLRKNGLTSLFKEVRVFKEGGPRRREMCTIVDECAQIAGSGLKPPFESPHLDFPEKKTFRNKKLILRELFM